MIKISKTAFDAINRAMNSNQPVTVSNGDYELTLNGSNNNDNSIKNLGDAGNSCNYFLCSCNSISGQISPDRNCRMCDGGGVFTMNLNRLNTQHAVANAKYHNLI